MPGFALTLLFLLFFSLIRPCHAAEDCASILVENAEGASIVILASGEKRELQIDDTLAKGDAVATGKEAWVDLRLCDGSGLRVGERSKMAFEDALAATEAGFVSWAFDLLKGSLLATVEGDDKRERVKMRVRTPSASLGVRGTEFLIDAGEGGETTVHTLEGEVLLGRREDYTELAKTSFRDFQARFEAIRKEHKSRMAMGQARPEKAMAFDPKQVREQRVAFFRKPIERMHAAAARARFREAKGRLPSRNGNAMPGAAAGAPAPRPGALPKSKRDQGGKLQERKEHGPQERKQERQERRDDRSQDRNDDRFHGRRDQKLQPPPGRSGPAGTAGPQMKRPQTGGGAARGGGQRRGPGRR